MPRRLQAKRCSVLSLYIITLSECYLKLGDAYNKETVEGMFGVKALNTS